MPRLLADLVDRDDVVVLEGRHGPGLEQEPLCGLGRAGQLRPDDLQGHRPEQVGVLGLEDEAHAALAEQPADAIVGQPTEFVRRPWRLEEIVAPRPR